MLLTIVVIATQFEGSSPGPEKVELTTVHASTGIIFLMLMLARVTWRTLNPNPIHSYSIKPWQKLLAISLHRSIYIIIIAQCLLGILMLLTSGQTLHFFNAIELPPLLEKTHATHQTILGFHYLMSVMIYPLFAVHITAAIYHQIFGLIEDHS